MAVIGNKKIEGESYSPPSYMGNKTRSIIGKTVVIKGNISTKEEIEIHGKIEGNIESDKMVDIKTEGGVKGNVKAEEVIVEGKIDGDIDAKVRTTITPQGKVSGKIITDRLVIEEGAVFRGTVEMGGSPRIESKPKEVKNA